MKKDTRKCQLCGKEIKNDYARMIYPVGFELLNFCLEHEGDKRVEEIIKRKKEESKNTNEEFYIVGSCVCDYGIYNKEGKLELLLNQRKNAEEICKIMNEDYRSTRL
ncbi:TPA: hypothetical protein ACGFBU_001634 [Clostridium perfringens]|uniref:hypothetical protein n=1 Tax=Clostridium perfringens TaxID=1502 RepID=UPI00155D9686|nr:hypothetical protein [Clostridium perfringens]MDK0560913.1 hypothetical protein [Clostridium perfringens]